MFRKLLSLLLCLCLLSPSLALGEQDAYGLRFSLQCEVNPAAFPEGDPAILSGLADLARIASLSGTLDLAFTGCFDLNAQLCLAGNEEIAADLRLYGTDACWMVQSSLLGEETLMVNMIALLEFAMKAYAHLGVPMQRAALLVPYAHTSALEAPLSAFNAVMNASEGERTIPKAEILALAEQLQQIAETDRAFQYWVQAIALEAGYDETINATLSTLTDWADSIIAEDGVHVVHSGATETWRTGETTLFTRTMEDTVTAWTATPPVTLTGYQVTVKYNGQPDGEHILHILIADEYDDPLLDAAVKAANIPDLHSEVPITGHFSLQVDAAGMALMDEIHLLFEGQGRSGAFALSKLEPASRAPQVTLTGFIQTYIPDAIPDFSHEQLQGTNLLSINDATLTPLMERIASPLLTGLIPLLVATPASAIQSLLDVLTSTGVLGLLLNGGASAGYDD